MVEATLVEQAANFDPRRLSIIAQRLADCLDPDGTLTDDADHQRTRELDLSRNRDGSYSIRGRLTPLCGAIWAPIMDAQSQPIPGPDGSRDPRTGAQRRADGFQDAGLLLIRAGELPHNGGAAVTLLVNVTDEQLATGTGLATTGHGDLIPIPRILELAGEAQTLSVVLDTHGGVMSYGQTRRIVPPQMRLAITARDKGCSFPGCDRPPAYTQAHHFREFAADHGPTSVANCGLVCAYHHREFGRHGWLGVMIDGCPHWIPPAWVDPERRPMRNTTHDPPLR